MSENNGNDRQDKYQFFKRVFTPGTVECAIACGIVGVLVALLLMWIGIWRTLLICVLVGIGVFIGGVKDKRAFLRRLFGSGSDRNGSGSSDS